MNHMNNCMVVQQRKPMRRGARVFDPVHGGQTGGLGSVSEYCPLPVGTTRVEQRGAYGFVELVRSHLGADLQGIKRLYKPAQGRETFLEAVFEGDIYESN